MCGWPAGVGYPPADGELEQAIAPTPEPEPETADADEHAGAQLDALAGMAERRSEPMPVVDDATATLDAVPTAEASDTPDTTGEASATDDDEPATEAPSEAGATADVSHTAADADADAETEAETEVDPLTAPIEALTDAAEPTSTSASAPSSATVDDAHTITDTPLAEVAAQVVAAAADSPTNEEPLQVDDDAAPVAPEAPAAPPEPGRAASLARPTQLLIVAAAMLNLVLAGMQLAFGNPVDASMTTVVLATSLVALGVWTGAAVAFLHWVSRAYAHVASYSSYRQRHGANMALGGWLIPIAGLLIGYRVLQDLWTGSNPATRHEADAKPANARVIDLWLLGLVTACIFAYAMPLALGDSALWSGIAALGVVIAGLALASVISTVSNWQTADLSESAPTVETALVADPAAEGTVTTRVDDLEMDAEEANAPQPVSTSAE